MTEQPQRFEGASLVALFGAVLLLVSPLLTWFDPGGSAWSLLELLDLVIIFTAVYVGVAATGRLLDVDRGTDRRGVPIAGGLALVAVLATMVEPPPVARDASLGFGAWLALLGSAIIVTAGLLDLARVSVTVSVGRESEDAAAEAPPVPTPPAAAPDAPLTDAPPSRTPSLLRPERPPAAADQAGEDE